MDKKLFEDNVTSFANILEESLNEIYIFDAKTLRFIQVNKGARLNMGYSMEELSNLTPLDLKPEFTFESFEKLVEPLLTDKKEKIQFTTVHRRKDGSLYDVEVHLQLSTFQSIPAFIAMVLDVTERKQVENERNTKSTFLQLHQIAAVLSNEAKEIEDAFIQILKSVCSYTGWPIGHVYVISDNDKNLLEPTAIWNNEDFGNLQRFCESTKVTEFKKGRGLPGRVMADCRPHWIKDVTKDHDFSRKQIAKELGIKTGFACPVMSEKEVVAVLEFFSTEVIEPDNQLMEVVSDVGTQLGRVFERKRIEEEHIKIQKLESVGILAGGIAHDFNNYLQGIMSNIATVKECIETSDELYRNLANAEKAVLQAKGLTRQLLTFSRGGEPVRKIISISETIRDSANIALSGSNARCEFDIPHDLCPIEADKGQMNQVINNLLTNANQAMPKGGTIKIKAEKTNIKTKNSLPLKEIQYVRITIADKGAGIPKEHLQKIFDPFFTTREKGSGLGLTTTYSIIKKHGGYITVESKVGTGTTFYIYLPALEGKGSSEIVPIKDRDKRGKEKDVEKATRLEDGRRILFMDDNLLIRMSTAEHLRNLKYDVQTTENGTKAIELYKYAMKSGKPFDAVVMDLTIPDDIGGKEAIDELLKIDSNVKAVVASGYSNDPAMSNFRKYGFRGVVTKPYEIYELDEILQEMIAADN